GTIMSVSEISKVGGQWMVISGAVTSSATDTGNTTLEILANVGLNVDDTTIDFLSGYVNSTQAVAILDSSGTNITDWLNSTGSPFTNFADTSHRLNNTGSTPVNVTVSMDKDNAEHWLCGQSGATCPGDNAMVQVKALDTTSACIDGEVNTYTEVADYDSKSTVLLCTNFKPTDGSDTLETLYQLTLPQEAPTGTVTAVFTYTVEAI
ncbi:hypothetical protein HN652_03185, partial [archaeon]|nr:hypothetical protein [archaeon]MBT6869231.1 hypothetical protein [archaeon]MBT7193767.1 hypothetical protein [archaeon]MBT7381414.1 hypothetical protein [archaeon]MBT7507993.1 hypothetical protein [archaeon]